MGTAQSRRGISKAVKELCAEEWRMYKDCSPNELEICYLYEYVREVCRQSPSQPTLFPDPVHNKLYPEWPRKPYLMIPAPVREQRVIQLQGGAPDYLRSLNMMPPFSVPILPEVAKKYLEGFEVFELSEDGSKLQQRHRWPIQEISDAHWVALFRIDWQRSDQETLADLAAWLKEHRPKAFPSRVTRPTGAASYLRQLEADLKALGALRLLHFYKRWENIPTEASIYYSQAGWMKAQRRAETRLKFFQL
jgi:hypothetical protein